MTCTAQLYSLARDRVGMRDGGRGCSLQRSKDGVRQGAVRDSSHRECIVVGTWQISVMWPTTKVLDEASGVQYDLDRRPAVQKWESCIEISRARDGKRQTY